jgi:amino acid adenylation domain-containing protein
MTRDRDQAARASLGQERLWSLLPLSDVAASYNLARAIRLTGPLRVDHLISALQQIRERHPALRSRFRQAGDRLLHEVTPAGGPAPEITVQSVPDLRGAQRRARADAAAPFDLRAGPSWRAAVYQVAPDRSVLLIATHHLVCDGWSLGLLLSEVAELYNALGRAEPARLPPLRFTYHDYAAWQREQAEREAATLSLAYWREHLHGAAALELPADRPRPPAASLRGEELREPLPPRLVADLAALCREHATTAYLAGLAGFVAFLSRYTQQRDLCVGVPVADRHLPGTEGLVGFLVNNLVLRFRVTGDPRFADLLSEARSTLLAGLAHQDVPFERLVSQLAPERDLSRSPLFQVAFNDDGDPLGEASFAGLEVEEVPTPLGVSKFDLTVGWAPGAREPAVTATFRTDLFEPATIRRLLRNYLTLIGAAARAPETRLSQLPALSIGEFQTVVHDWNRPAARPPPPGTVLDLIAGQVDRQPDAPAVRTSGEEVTYRQLWQRADRLARQLRGHGVRSGVPVAMVLPRGVAAIVGLLGIMAAGGASVPADPADPADRIRRILDQSAVALVVTSPEYAHLAGGRPVVAPDPPAGREPGPPLPAIPADELAYVIYTSGSTGQPLGVAVDHRALLSLLHAPTYGSLSAAQTRLQLSRLSFDASVLEVWGTLSTGGCVAVPEHRRDFLSQVEEGIERLGADTALFVSPQLRLVVEHRPALLGKLREAQVGGDTLAAGHGRRAAALLGEGSLTHVYGPTECTLFATASPIPRTGPVPALLPIGRPVGRTRAYVLDEKLQPVPIGAVGQLFLAGPQLAWGYLDQPGTTGLRFRPDPFVASPGQRMYATGDRARWRPDGQLEFLGRFDDQVKLRGYRIELSEIASAMLAHPGVRDAAVLLREDLPGGPALVGYAVTEAGVTPVAINETMRRRLPGYMLPGRLVLVDRLPLTANGKLDTASLPPPTVVEPAPATGPADQVESTVHRLWQQVLDTATPIPLDGKFFEVGGDSITVVALFEQVTGSFPEADLSMVDLFTYNTIRELATRLRAATGVRGAGRAQPPEEGHDGR